MRNKIALYTFVGRKPERKIMLFSELSA